VPVSPAPVPSHSPGLPLGALRARPELSLARAADARAPGRAERVASLTALLGPSDPRAADLAEGLRATARLHHDRHVTPLVAAHWPAALASPFGEKLRIGACDLYAVAPYMTLFLSRARPLPLRVLTGLGDALPVPPRLLGLAGRGAMAVLGRFAYAELHRRVALVSAFIVVVDHVFDHVMTDPPEARGARLASLLSGATAPDRPELALAQALARAMGEGLEGEARGAFDHAMGRFDGWIRAVVRALRGLPDPEGLGHRRAGVEGTIDGLLFPVGRLADPPLRAWMVEVSMFVQMLDDYLDLEADRAAGRETPATTGDWGLGEVAGAWERTLVGLEAVVRGCGLTSPRSLACVRATYVGLMVQVARAMFARPEDGVEYG
jgi:hypothetical protein